LRQEDREFKASLGYKGTLCHKTKQQKPIRVQTKETGKQSAEVSTGSGWNKLGINKSNSDGPVFNL
jgi:hypothetical protein